MYAALECRAEIVNVLLENGAHPNLRAVSTGESFMEKGQTALLIASGCFIARRRAQLAPERHMPASYAEYELAAPEKMVRELLLRGARVSITDSEGRTPLMMAAITELSLAGLALYGVIAWLERRVIYWQPASNIEGGIGG